MKYKYTYIFQMFDGSQLKLWNTNDTYVSEEQQFSAISELIFVYGYLPNSNKMMLVNMHQVATMRIEIEEVP